MYAGGAIGVVIREPWYGQEEYVVRRGVILRTYSRVFLYGLERNGFVRGVVPYYYLAFVEHGFVLRRGGYAYFFSGPIVFGCHFTWFNGTLGALSKVEFTYRPGHLGPMPGDFSRIQTGSGCVRKVVVFVCRSVQFIASVLRTLARPSLASGGDVVNSGFRDRDFASLLVALFSGAYPSYGHRRSV